MKPGSKSERKTTGWEAKDIRPMVMKTFLAGTSVETTAYIFDLKPEMVEDIIRLWGQERA